MIAKFNGTCRGCRKPIAPGDPIHFDSRGARHPECRDRKEKRHRENNWNRVERMLNMVERTTRLYDLSD